MMFVSSQQKQNGLTLIELLIAMLLGTLMILGATSMFTANKRVYKEVDYQGRLAENARFAMEMIIRDLRMTGFVGCADQCVSRYYALPERRPFQTSDCSWTFSVSRHRSLGSSDGGRDQGVCSGCLQRFGLYCDDPFLHSFKRLVFAQVSHSHILPLKSRGMNLRRMSLQIDTGTTGTPCRTVLSR